MSKKDHEYNDNYEPSLDLELTPLYLFIIWEKSREKTNPIFDDLGKKFVIREVYEVTWSKEKFIKNLKRFYGTISTAQQKAELFGAGPFLLVLVSDPNPNFTELETIKGIDIINSNILESKKLYRKWIGKDFAIHSSISEKESNHNLTLFFGKHSKDFDKELPEKWDGSIKKWNSELSGHNGWETMKQLLYVLNGTYYVILRNFEDLPEKLNQKDIDILTENPMIRYIVKADFFEAKDTVSSLTAKVGDKKVLFDFKYVRDHYFDKKWSNDILKRRILHPNGFYVPCKEDYFYTLLYHVIFQKPTNFDRYKKILNSLTEELCINNSKDKIFYDFDKSKKFLQIYMKQMGYHNTTSQQYKFLHNIVFQKINTAIFLIKTEGIKFLISTVKAKIKRKFS